MPLGWIGEDEINRAVRQLLNKLIKVAIKEASKAEAPLHHGEISLMDIDS